MKKAIEQLEPKVRKSLKDQFEDVVDYGSANHLLSTYSGIENFFNTQEEFLLCKEWLRLDSIICENSSRREYGDYQTPLELTDKICAYLVDSGISPDVLIEPTFGKGSFLISCIKYFTNLESIHGVELYEPYVWFSKFRILQFALKSPEFNKPKIRFYNEDVYDFDFRKIADSAQNLAVVGNPPWVTNAELGSLSSRNLPQKRNLKKFSGLDALTGKSNFDISECIILMMLDAFSEKRGHLAMLVKNTVIKNLVYDLPNYPYKVSNIASYRIDTKKHFNASVAASLLICRLGSVTEDYQCRVAELDLPNAVKNKFGWVDEKFVSNVSSYGKFPKYDGKCPFVWRQGLKHDCSKIMELTQNDNAFVNGFDEEVVVENDLLYGLAKSSDLRQPILRETQKVVIVTQTKVGEKTIEKLKKYPNLLSYLQANKHLFDRRKSSIYQNKPPFSIFGIGDYSFKPFKVAISGLYKRPQFCLIPLQDEKPVMIDDTCYLLGFDDFSYAIFVWTALNNYRIQKLLDSIAFKDAKRPFTKRLLMRIALATLVNNLDYSEVLEYILKVDNKLRRFISKEHWLQFTHYINANAPKENQLELF